MVHVQESQVETLRWRDGALELIDQRRLPGVVEYVRCDSANAVAEAIRDMVVRGAPAIGCTAAFGVAVEALRLQGESPGSFAEQLELGMRTLQASRPTAVNLFWALSRMRVVRESFGERSPPEIAERLLQEAHRIHEVSGPVVMHAHQGQTSADELLSRDGHRLRWKNGSHQHRRATGSQ